MAAESVEAEAEAEGETGADPGRVGVQVKLKQVDALRGQVSLLEARVLQLSQAKSALELKIDGLQGGGRAAAASGAGAADTKKMSKFQLEMSAAKDAVRCEEVQARVRGRGRASFPTGGGWSGVCRASGFSFLALPEIVYFRLWEMPGAPMLSLGEWVIFSASAGRGAKRGAGSAVGGQCW